MKRAAAGLTLALLLALAAAARASDDDVPDFGGLIAKEVVHEDEQEEEAAVHLGDGGGPQKREMEDLLHWAIEHSDPEALKQQAGGAAAARDPAEQRERLQQLRAAFDSQETEADVMRGYLRVLRGGSDADEDAVLAALAELQVLVEPIDNANDLVPMDGIAPLVALLSPPAALRVRAAAAAVLGTASSNNAAFQAALLAAAPRVLEPLLDLAASRGGGADGERDAARGLYALGALVRTLPAARDAFRDSRGLERVQALMGPAAAGPRVRQKALSLVSDLMEISVVGAGLTGDGDSGGGAHGVHGGGGAPLTRTQMAEFASAALHLLQQSDELDAREKGLQALRALIMHGGEAGRGAVEDASAEAVLRELLTELELAGPEIPEEGWDGRVGPRSAYSGDEEDDGGGGDGGGGGGEGDGGGGRGNGGEEDEEEADMYRQYVVALCADLLHRISVDHDEL